MRWLGLDVHKRYVVVLEICQGAENRFSRFSLPGGLREFCSQLDRDCHIVMEASSNTFLLAEILAEHAGRVVVSDPAQTRGVLSQALSNDRVAAQALARLLQAEFIRTVWTPPPEIRDLRSLSAHHRKLSRTRTRLINRLRALLNQELIEAPRVLLNEAGRTFLDGLFRGQSGCRLCLCGLVRQIDHVESELENVERALETWSRQSEAAGLLMTIPGMGPIFAAHLMSQVGDIRRFPTSRQLCAYAGLVPRVYQSGITRRTGRISKAGSGTFRWVLTLVAWSVSRKTGLLDKFREQLLSRKPKKVVHAAVARKLLTIIWSMLTEQRPLREHDQALDARKKERLAGGAEPSPEALEIPPKPKRPCRASSRRVYIPRTGKVRREEAVQESPVAPSPGGLRPLESRISSRMGRDG